MAHRRIYASPPLVEALCDIRFEPSQIWDWTIPGLLYAEIRHEYPLKEQAGQLEVQMQESQISQRSTRRLRFLTEDRTALVQVGENTLVLNCLRPYPGWEGFRSMLWTLLDKYRAVAEPVGATRCSLRFINRIEIPGSEATVDDYFVKAPPTPENLPTMLSGWSVLLDIPDIPRSGIMRLQSGSAPAEDGFVAFMLDLRFLALDAASLGLNDNLRDWIDRAHDVIEETFEASITDQARALFKEEEHSHGQLLLRG